MSRTFKDRPIFVKVYELMKQGEFSHMHFYAQLPTVIKRERTIEIEKKNVKEINELRNYLIENDFEFVEKEIKGTCSLKDSYDVNGKEHIIYETSPKKIAFTFVEEFLRNSHYSRYCTDLEYYDPKTGKDTRDGKTASCTPYPSIHRDSYDKPDNKGKTKRQTSFKNMTKEFNNGYGFENIEDYENESFWTD